MIINTVRVLPRLLYRHPYSPLQDDQPSCCLYRNSCIKLPLPVLPGSRRRHPQGRRIHNSSGEQLAFAAPVHRFSSQVSTVHRSPLVLPCPLSSVISPSGFPCLARLVGSGVLGYIELGELTRPLPSTRRSRPGQPAEQGQVHAKPPVSPTFNTQATFPGILNLQLPHQSAFFLSILATLLSQPSKRRSDNHHPITRQSSPYFVLVKKPTPRFRKGYITAQEHVGFQPVNLLG